MLTNSAIGNAYGAVLLKIMWQLLLTSRRKTLDVVKVQVKKGYVHQVCP